MINSFKDYLVEEERVVYFTFGRMHPPTIGHGKLIDKLASMAGKNPYRIFVSQSQDPKKNPLNYSDKIKSIRKMFPKHARNIMINTSIKNAMDILPVLYNQGFKKVVMVVGSDRINEFDALLNKYNGKDGRHGFYNFNDIKVVSAGERDPDAEGIEGMSASKMRALANDNDFTLFSQGLPKTMSTKDARKLFNDVRKGMGLKEEKVFKNHIQLDSISDIRESFINGQLFDLGESVIIKKTDEVGTITVLGSNYVIVETADGKRSRKWLDAVEKIEEQDNKKSMYKDKPDWGTPEAAAKAKAITPGEVEEGGLWDNIRKRRAAGKPKLKPSDKNYPKTLNIESDERKKETSQDPDIKDRPGSQPKVYHKGLSKSTKLARDRQFKRQAKMSDDNPAAYKPAPGDKEAKTKPSKHTLKFKKMFGEEQDPVDIAKARVNRQKELAAKRHDRIMDRARLLKTKEKNQETK